MTANGVYTAVASGQIRSAPTETGITSAAKFVPQRGDQQEALAGARDAGAAEERGQREAEPHEAAEKRHAADGSRGRGHVALVNGLVASRERPEALARDHDAVGTSHSAEPWKVGGLVGDEQGGENLRATHRARIARRRPPDKCRAAYLN